MKSTSLLIFFLATAFSTIHAQVQNHPEDIHGHHNHHKNEIAMANSVVYLLNEKEYSYGMHLHYTKNVFREFGAGVGYERIFDDHNHNTIGLVFNYRIFENLGFSLSPGIAFSGLENKGKFALHFESAYEFQIKDFHLGPAIEYAFDSDDKHLSLGFHIGYGF